MTRERALEESPSLHCDVRTDGREAWASSAKKKLLEALHGMRVEWERD